MVYKLLFFCKTSHIPRNMHGHLNICMEKAHMAGSCGYCVTHNYFTLNLQTQHMNSKWSSND